MHQQPPPPYGQQLPMYNSVQQSQAEATQLLRPLAIVQQQQQQQQQHGKQPRSWNAMLQHLASRKAAGAFYVLLALGLVWFVAAGRAKPQPLVPPEPLASQPTPALQQQQQQQQSSTVLYPAGSDGSSSSSSKAAQPTLVSPAGDMSVRGGGGASGMQLTVRCPFGSLPGTWVSGAPSGAKWQVLPSTCQLTNWLAAYHTAAADAASSNASSSSSSSSTVLPFVNILLLSDSVDRYVLQHVCDYLGGVKHTVRAQQKHMQPAAGGDAADAEQQQQQEQQQAADAEPAAVGDAAAGGPDSSAEAAAASGGPSNLNATAYAFHTCQLPDSVPLKLASSYFPGVHPTGPFHRGLTQNYAARIRAAVSMWEDYAGAGQPPHVVGVASGLWDVARLWMHERQELEGPELSRRLLDGWVANFSSVVRFTQAQLPQTQLWLTHTTMLPAHDAVSGAMAKPYLGRRYFIEQLNAAAASAARQLGLQLLDYDALSSRFRDGQAYLTDLIHPNAEVALELFNLLLNLAIEPRGV